MSSTPKPSLRDVQQGPPPSPLLHRVGKAALPQRPARRGLLELQRKLGLPWENRPASPGGPRSSETAVARQALHAFLERAMARAWPRGLQSLYPPPILSGERGLSANSCPWHRVSRLGCSAASFSRTGGEDKAPTSCTQLSIPSRPPSLSLKSSTQSLRPVTTTQSPWGLLLKRAVDKRIANLPPSHYTLLLNISSKGESPKACFRFRGWRQSRHSAAISN